MTDKVFLLSPARCDGRRAQTLLNPGAEFPLAQQLRTPDGAPLGEVFAFLSGLYFRGKLTYGSAFASAASSTAPVRIITTNQGLLTPTHRVMPHDLADFARVDLSDGGAAFEEPFVRDAAAIARQCGDDTLVVLLGSIATDKYVAPLLRIFGERLVFPRDFVGRGDMSRGGLLLRHAREGRELEYVPIVSAVRHGKRPPKLEPVRDKQRTHPGKSKDIRRNPNSSE
jgi:hypothetical protein